MALLKDSEIKSPYDLRETIWYIIPGAMLLLLIFVFEYWFATQIKEADKYANFKQVDYLRQIHISDSIIQKNILEHSSLTNESTSNKVMFDTLNKVLYTPIFTLMTTPHWNDNWVFAALYVFLFLTVCYILGHIAYMVGTFLYERGLISKGYSYPYLKLLKLTYSDKNIEELDASQGFYRGIFFWTAFIFITHYIFFIIWGYKHYDILNIIFVHMIFLFIFIPTRLKFILANITQWEILERNRKHNYNYPRIRGYAFWISTFFILFILVLLLYVNSKKNYLLFYGWVYYFIGMVFFVECGLRKLSKSKWFSIKVFNEFKKLLEYDKIKLNGNNVYNREKRVYEYFFIRWYNFFGNELDKFSKDYFHIQHSFDQNFIDKYKLYFMKIYKCDYKEFSRHNYWLAKFYVQENSLYLSHQINFWENVYRFSKSLAAAFLLALLYCSISFMLQYWNLKYIINFYGQDAQFSYAINVLFLIPIVYFIITSITLRYYIYIYDNRYSRLVLRSFVSIVSWKK